MVAHLAVSFIAEVATLESPAPLWIAPVGVVLSSSVVALVVGHVLNSLRASAEVRREGYAEMSRVLISRVEYPYRIRRRTSDSPDALAELSRIGSDIQERLAAQRTWVAGESRAVSKLLDGVCQSMDAQIGSAASDAWRRPAIAAPEDMVLGDWGPGAATREPLNQFRRATTFRFGYRRLIPGVLWKRWVTRGR